MPAPSSQDLVSGIDPTGFTSITGAEVLQLVNAGVPYTDKGLVLLTTDVAGVPEVPNAAATTKWKRYVWVRQGAVNIRLYVWNDVAASAATYLKWIEITVASIGNGSVTNAMLAGFITSDKILSVLWSAVSGAPTFLQSTDSPAAGDISGTYATGFSIGADKVITSKILDANVTKAKLAADVGYYLIQSVRAESGALFTGTVGAVETIPYDDTIPQIGEGKAYNTLDVVITPKAAASKLRVVFEGFVSTDLGGAAGARGILVSLFNSAAVGAIGAGVRVITLANEIGFIRVEAVVAAVSTAARTYNVRLGISNSDANASNWCVNGLVAGRKLGGVLVSRLTVDELYA